MGHLACKKEFGFVLLILALGNERVVTANRKFIQMLYIQILGRV